MFLRYPLGQKEWCLHDLDTLDFFGSRNVQFMEHVFSFSNVLLAKHASTTSLNENILLLQSSIFGDELSFVESSNAPVPSSHNDQHVLNCDNNALGEDYSSGLMSVHVASDNTDRFPMLQCEVLNVAKQQEVGSKMSVRIKSENAKENGDALGCGHRTKMPSTRLCGCSIQFLG